MPSVRDKRKMNGLLRTCPQGRPEGAISRVTKCTTVADTLPFTSSAPVIPQTPSGEATNLHVSGRRKPRCGDVRGQARLWTSLPLSGQLPGHRTSDSEPPHHAFQWTPFLFPALCYRRELHAGGFPHRPCAVRWLLATLRSPRYGSFPNGG